MTTKFVLLFTDGSFSGFVDVHEDVEYHIDDNDCYRAFACEVPPDAVPISDEDYENYMREPSKYIWNIEDKCFNVIPEQEGF